MAATTHLGGLAVGYIYLQGGRGGGLTAEIKYRYLKWKMNRMRRKFDVYSGGRVGKVPLGPARPLAAGTSFA